MHSNYNLFMKGKILSLATVISICYFTSSASVSDIKDVINTLENARCYNAEVKYQVLMSLQNDVDYTIRLESTVAPDDTILPASFLIDWTMPTPGGASTGFSAYFNGNVYLFRGDRLLEYHYPEDKNAFYPSGSAAGILQGVHRTMQFASLLPQFIGEELNSIIQNKEYTYKFTPDSVVSGKHYSVFNAQWIAHDEVLKEIEYRFNPQTGLPMYSEFENNPGALAEQTIVASYEYPLPGNSGCIELSEEMLIGKYPEVFEKFRESSYAIENLPGQKLPSFALATTTGERYTYRSGDGFRCPTVIALVDPRSTFARETIEAVRAGLDQVPYTIEIIWAFTGNNHDEIDELMPQCLPGEQALISAKSLARDTGASMFPVLIFTKPSGIVEDVTIGYNNNLTSDVIQKASILAN